MSGLRSVQLPEGEVLGPTGARIAMDISFLGGEDYVLKGTKAPNSAAS